MALDPNINTLEKDKFAEDEDLGTTVKTLTKILGSITGAVTFPGLGKGDVDEVELDDTEWVEATLGGIVTTRSTLNLQNISGNGNVVLWRYTAPEPLDDDFNVGWRIEDGGWRSILFQASATSKVYIKMLTGEGLVNLEELGP